VSKADNMLAILWLLKSRRKMSARELADELEIHIRTAYRLIDALCASGVPIVAEAGRDGGYSIPERFKLEPLFFDADEQKALLQAAAFARATDYPSGEALERAVAKIKRYANPEQLARMEERETLLEVVPPPPAPALAPLLRELEACIELGIRLEIGYRSGYVDAVRRREIEPYGLVRWQSNWYVVGYCLLRKVIRSFRVDRISSSNRTASAFERPASFSARDFLMESLMPVPTGSSSSDSGFVAVRLRGSAEAIDSLCGHWRFGRALVERSGEIALFRLEETSLYTHALYELLSYGGRIRVERPDELRACLADLAESLAEYYRS